MPFSFLARFVRALSFLEGDVWGKKKISRRLRRLLGGKERAAGVVSGMTLAGYSLAGRHVDVNSGSDGLVYLVEYHQAAPPV
ncbi:hypothetical protein SJR98_17215 [Aeromonas hydrophila]|uniref:hypothetical protein n=1 Tax=Aeromonas hydrophila TaxID=644 RepID=UPI0029D5648E|nr:hypothetical protein [Aeromonas hydrophila]MDX7779826.1 hypothetical protein [Aeromonas hydrophila]